MAKIKRKDFVKAWVKALRSGKYKQTTRRLRCEENDGTCSYCCLGVACEVGANLKIRGAKSQNSRVFLGKWFVNIMGSDNPELNKSEMNCVKANDDYCWSFKRIANALEKKYL